MRTFLVEPNPTGRAATGKKPVILDLIIITTKKSVTLFRRHLEISKYT